MSESPAIVDQSEITVLQSVDLEYTNMAHLYEVEKGRTAQLEKELNEMTQKFMHEAQQTEYWKRKCLDLKLESQLAQFDAQEARQHKQGNDSKKLKAAQGQISQLEDQIKHLVEAHKHEILEKEDELQAQLRTKDEVIDRIKGAVERLNDKLDEQKSEKGIVDNILALPDHNMMMRLVYTAQYKVNQKIMEEIAKKNKAAEKSSSESSGDSNTNSYVSDRPAMMMQQPMYMNFSPMMLPPGPVQVGAALQHPNIPRPEAKKENETQQKVERED